MCKKERESERERDSERKTESERWRKIDAFQVYTSLLEDDVGFIQLVIFATVTYLLLHRYNSSHS